MKLIRHALIALSIMAAFAGCASGPPPAKEAEASKPGLSPAKEAKTSKVNSSIQDNWPKLRIGLSREQVENLLGPLEWASSGVAFSGASLTGMLTGNQKPSKSISVQTFACQGRSLEFCNGKLARWELDTSLLRPTDPCKKTGGQGRKGKG